MVETVESTLSVPAPEKLAEGWEEDEESTTEGGWGVEILFDVRIL